MRNEQRRATRWEGRNEEEKKNEGKKERRKEERKDESEWKRREGETETKIGIVGKGDSAA